MTSDDIVEALKPYGRVSIFQQETGWSAKLELFTSTVESTIRSEHKHPSMLSALVQLQAKTQSVIQQLRKLVRIGIEDESLEQ